MRCILLAAALAASPTLLATERWYTPQQAEAGRPLYATHCAACHGAAGEGQPGWESRDGSGYYPPPPLDRTGHASMHPLKDLLAALEMGTAPRGGTMPSFSDVLDESQRQAVLAYVQSLWPDETYLGWLPYERGEKEAMKIGESHDKH
jgi:mono/diheme cytochrome c family protein